MRPLDARSAPLAGTQLIEASAGTGKTHTITTLVLRLVLEGVRLEEILVVTFTRAATAELRDRVRARLVTAARAAARLERGLPAFPPDASDADIEHLLAGRAPGAARRALEANLRAADQASILTIHGYCQRVLQLHALESGLRPDAELVDDLDIERADAARDVLVGEYARATPEERTLLDELGVTKVEVLERVGALLAGPLPVVPVPSGREEPPQAEAAAHAAAWAAAERALAGREPALAAVVAQAKVGAQLPAERLVELAGLLRGPPGPLPRWLEHYDGERVSRTGRQLPPDRFFAAVTALLARAAELERARVAWATGWLLRGGRSIAARLARHRAQAGVVTFDDLLALLGGALQGPGGEALAARVRARWPVALVDEFQDTDPTQYAIFRRVHGAARALFLIGDPKQAIYSFRGADVFTYLEAARDAGEAAHTLTVNHRSDPALVSATNALFTRGAQPFRIPDIAYTPVTARAGRGDRLEREGAPASGLEVLTTGVRAPGSGERAFGAIAGPELAALTKPVVAGIVREGVVESILRLLASGHRIEGRPLVPADVAVLTRTNRQAFELQAALRERGVPTVLLGDSSVFEAEEAEELARLMAAMAEPGRVTALRGALATRLLGTTAEELLALYEDEAAWEAQAELFRRAHDRWSRAGFFAAFQGLARAVGLAPRLLSYADGERRLTNLRHLVELLHGLATRERLGISGLSRRFDALREHGRDEELPPDAAQLRLESDAHCLTLTTVHRAKGLEYGVVYCPWLWDEAALFPSEKRVTRFHDADAPGPLLLDVSPARPKEAHSLQRAATEARAEAVRLAYVALTRARHRTVVVWGPFKGAGASPLGHLLLEPSDEGKLTPEAALASVEALRRAAPPGTVRVEALQGPPAPPFRAEPSPEVPLEAQVARRALVRSWRASSFSALVAGQAHASPPEALGLDHDVAPEATGAAAAPVAGLATSAAPAAPAVVPMAEFPRGARAGELMHAVLELHLGAPAGSAGELASAAEAGEALEALALRQTIRFGYEPVWAAPLAEAVRVVERTPLDAAGTRLSAVPAARRLPELGFTLPAAAVERPGTVAEVAAAFAEHPGGAVPPSYARAVGGLGFPPLAGYLRGFIDLVFEDAAGRVHVVDYKSNHLGVAPDDYAPPALARCMVESHYILQYHLYLLAVHRWLALRRPDYDPERHLGGAYYLFVRGLSPERGPARGVFFDRPPLARLEALERALQGRAR